MCWKKKQTLKSLTGVNGIFWFPYSKLLRSGIATLISTTVYKMPSHWVQLWPIRFSVWIMSKLIHRSTKRLKTYHGGEIDICIFMPIFYDSRSFIYRDWAVKGKPGARFVRFVRSALIFRTKPVPTVGGRHTLVNRPVQFENQENVEECALVRWRGSALVKQEPTLTFYFILKGKNKTEYGGEAFSWWIWWNLFLNVACFVWW